MSLLEITIARKDNSLEHPFPISPETKFDDFREAAQTVLQFSDFPPCQVTLERTGKILQGNLTLNSLGIDQSDRLLFAQPAESIGQGFKGIPGSFSLSESRIIRDTKDTVEKYRESVKYTLKLSILYDSKIVWEYSIHLPEYYENNPKQFFSNSSGRETRRFKTTLEGILEKSLNDVKVEKLINEWCEDIIQGYRLTNLSLEI